MQKWRVIRYDSIDSTNAALKRMTQAEHGTVLCSRLQTAGRGRLGRSFASNEGGLYLSVLLKREEPTEQLLHLTPMVAVAVRRAIADACGVQTQIKWINDLVLDGKKVCGILTELASEGLIVGIGINCNTEHFPPELQDIATSVHRYCGAVDAERLLQALLLRLEQMDEGLFSQKEAWLHEYAQHCITIGKPVQLIRGESRREAFAEGIDANGALLVRLADGTRETVTMGEASIRTANGYA